MVQLQAWYSHATPGLLCRQNRACAGGQPWEGWEKERVRPATNSCNPGHHHFQRPLNALPASLTCLPLPINRLPHRHCHNPITVNSPCPVSHSIRLIEPVSRPARHHASPQEHRFKSPRGRRRAWACNHEGQQGERWSWCRGSSAYTFCDCISGN